MGILGRKRTQKASTLGPAPCRHCGKSSGCSCAKHPPRCRYCGKLSAYGWSQLMCIKCERKRSKIEIGAMSQYSIAARRGWTGPRTIGDDELLLTLPAECETPITAASRTTKGRAQGQSRAQKPFLGP